MRTPNTECVICEKPLYRRPFETRETRFSACMKHRSDAQVLFGQTDEQKKALKLGRNGNHRSGFIQSEATRLKIKKAVKRFWQNNPEKALERGMKIRGTSHYRWNGGVSRLNVSIRQMTEHRKWMDSVKARDNFMCIQCGSEEELESHHIKELSLILGENNVTNRDQARECFELWDIDNGITLCRKCHYKVHGRVYAD